MTPRIDALRAQLQALQALHDSGTLSDEAHAAARQPLERELVDAVTQAPAAMPPAPRPSRRLQAGLAVGVLALAVAGYAVTGSPGSAKLSADSAALAAAGAASGAAASDGGEAPVTEAQITEVVERMAQSLKDKPQDGPGWALLARGYSALGRHAEAVGAFEKAAALLSNDAGLLVDYADSLAALNGGPFTPQSLKLVERALQLDPSNLKALALSGSAAFDRRDYAAAVGLWERVERGLPAGSSVLPQVRASIAQARQMGGLPAPAGGAAAAATAVATAAPAAAAASVAARAAAPAGGAVSGRVTLAPALAARTSPEDTVFILARPAQGPRMPLAVLRKQVKDLPLDFKLDDSMAMAPGATISSHPQVIVVARISKSGQAMAQPGDLSGQSEPVAAGSQGVAIRISDVVGP